MTAMAHRSTNSVRILRLLTRSAITVSQIRYSVTQIMNCVTQINQSEMKPVEGSTSIHFDHKFIPGHQKHLISIREA